jgi:hypothetical protein
LVDAYLPPVVTRLLGNVDDVVAKVESLKGAIKSLGTTEVKIPVDIDKASLARAQAAVKSAFSGTSGSVKVGFDVNDASMAAARNKAAAFFKAPIAQNINFNVNNAQLLAAMAAQKGLTAATNQTTDAVRIGYGWWRLTRTALHWIIAGGSELLAVLIPATVAFGAFAAVALQGTVNAADHMNALYSATEATANMFHTTVGQALGLRSALQQAQDAANPMVYEALGSGVLIAKENFSGLADTGLQVMRFFDAFSAKLAYDFSSGGGLGATVNGLLSKMVPDLVQLGQIFGNLGRFMANFASAMPGLAEVLLGFAKVLSGVLVVLTQPAWYNFGGHLITIGMGFEESWRWGGLFGRLLGGLTGFLGRGADNLARFTARLGKGGLADAAAGAGSALEKASTALKAPGAGQ